MALTLIEKRTKRARLVTEARDLVDRSENGFNAEDQAQYDKLFAEVRSLLSVIQAEENLEPEERSLSEPVLTRTARTSNPGEGEQRGGGSSVFEYRTGSTRSAIRTERTAVMGSAINQWLRAGVNSLSAEQMREFRDLQADSDTIGGYLRPDQEFVARLIQAVDNLVFIRQWATVLPVTTADSLGVPTLETDMSDSAWTSELLTGTADTAMAFGKRELRPHPLAKKILVSNKLLRQTSQSGAINVETLIRERLSYKYAITKEQAYLTGTGAGQPLGVFVASADGIPTSRDVSTDNTTSSITGDGLMNAKYSLKPQYRDKSSTRWLFHTDAIKQIAKLKDGEGQYIWRMGLIGDEPDRLLNLPYHESLYAPSTFTTGLYVGILGDFSFYWIAQALTLQVRRLDELKAETDQVLFIAREEEDGMPVLAEAFARVKLG